MHEQTRVLCETKGGYPIYDILRSKGVFRYPTVDHARYFSFRQNGKKGTRKGTRLVISLAYRLDNLEQVRNACDRVGWTVYVHSDKVNEMRRGQLVPDVHLVLLLEPGVPERECVAAVIQHPGLLA
jgi:hypothetical protein